MKNSIYVNGIYCTGALLRTVKLNKSLIASLKLYTPVIIILSEDRKNEKRTSINTIRLAFFFLYFKWLTVFVEWLQDIFINISCDKIN